MPDRVDDDAQLAALGHKAELHRNFSMLYVRRIRCSIAVFSCFFFERGHGRGRGRGHG
jgi:hypothetical protein